MSATSHSRPRLRAPWADTLARTARGWSLHCIRRPRRRLHPRQQNFRTVGFATPIRLLARQPQIGVTELHLHLLDLACLGCAHAIRTPSRVAIFAVTDGQPIRALIELPGTATLGALVVHDTDPPLRVGRAGSLAGQAAWSAPIGIEVEDRRRRPLPGGFALSVGLLRSAYPVHDRAPTSTHRARFGDNALSVFPA